MSGYRIRGGTLVTVDDNERVLQGDLDLVDGRITALGAELPPPADGIESIDATGCFVMPGLVQAHVHLCQTLCRGAADDLPLLPWLRERVWPYEAALDDSALRAAVRLAAAELLLGGTTAILDMGTVHHTDVIGEELARIGLRAVIGKAMMDVGDGVPAGLRETTRDSIAESDELRRRWTGAGSGRLSYAYAPRFVLSCSEKLLRQVAERVADGARVHTHASEQLAEVEVVRRERGADNITYLSQLGLDGPRAAFAHCVHPTADERALLAARGTHVVHCPSSNLKLGSGISPIPEMVAEGISVALGADGAPCNNNLDGFLELRLAALLHAHRVGAGKWTAAQALAVATRGGARALGLGDEIGALEVGRRADVVIVDPRAPHATPHPHAVSALVYAVQSRDVRDVFVDGRLLVRQRELTALSGLWRDEVVATASAEAARIAAKLR